MCGARCTKKHEAFLWQSAPRRSAPTMWKHPRQPHLYGASSLGPRLTGTHQQNRDEILSLPPPVGNTARYGTPEYEWREPPFSHRRSTYRRAGDVDDSPRYSFVGSDEIRPLPPPLPNTAGYGSPEYEWREPTFSRGSSAHGRAGDADYSPSPAVANRVVIRWLLQTVGVVSAIVFGAFSVLAWQNSERAKAQADLSNALSLLSICGQVARNEVRRQTQDGIRDRGPRTRPGPRTSAGAEPGPAGISRTAVPFSVRSSHGGKLTSADRAEKDAAGDLPRGAVRRRQRRRPAGRLALRPRAWATARAGAFRRTWRRRGRL